MSNSELYYILICYLLGSIPVGYVLCFLLYREDIRNAGSGNIGAANVLRTKGKGAGAAVLLLDMAKGVLPVLYGLKHFDSPVLVMAGGAAVILGHLFSVFLKFKGGKGIACFLGVFLAYDPASAVVFCIAFLAVYVFWRFVSAGSMAGVSVVFFYVLFTRVVEVSILVFVIAVLIIIKHKDNIRRIACGCENKVYWKNNEK